jgi:hypothetical protein
VHIPPDTNHGASNKCNRNHFLKHRNDGTEGQEFSRFVHYSTIGELNLAVQTYVARVALNMVYRLRCRLLEGYGVRVGVRHKYRDLWGGLPGAALDIPERFEIDKGRAFIDKLK